MNADDILDQLSDSAVPLERLEAPAEPGVYAYFLADGARFPA